LNLHLIIFLLLSNIIYSQNFVDEFIEHYNEVNDYVLEFEYISKNNNEILFKNEGVLMVKKNKFRILIDQVLFIYDGKKYFNIINENKEVNVLKSNELSNYLIPSNLSKYLSKNRDKIEVSIGKEITIRYRDDFDNKFIVLVDKEYNIKRIDQKLTDTYMNSIFFNKILFDQNLNESLFKFKRTDYKDYYINEL
jgi:outer membrane lipoprotein-sorting protein